MFLILLKKDLLQNVQNLRYIIIFTLFPLLILSSVVVRTSLYQRLTADYEAVKKLQIQLADSLTAAGQFSQVRALGVTVSKRPNPISIFASGLEGEMVRSFTLSEQERPQAGMRKFASGRTRYFPPLDLVFIVGVILSLLALLLTFDCISGESEAGTLRLMLSGPLPRDMILLSKLASGWITLMAPLVLSLAGARFWVVLMGVPFAGDDFFRLFLVFVLSALYITFFFTLGVAMSTMAKRSATALIWCLFAWVLLALAAPNLVPMLVKQSVPIPPESRMVREKQAVSDEVNKVLAPQWRAELSESGRYTDIGEMLQEIDRRTGEEIGKRTDRIDLFYAARVRRQMELVQWFSRVSPSAGYTFASTVVSGTGVPDFVRFVRSVDEAGREYSLRLTGFDLRLLNPDTGNPPVTPAEARDLCSFRPKPFALREGLVSSLPDFAVLLAGIVMFFLISLARFLRYDPN